MKNLYLLVLMFVALTNSYLSKAQNIIVTNPSNPISCDGTAFFSDYAIYNPSYWTWTWYQDSITVIATGDTILNNLCTGSYYLSIDSANYSIVQPFTITDQCSYFTAVPTLTNSTPGNCDGAFSYTPTNGAAPYLWEWSTVPGSVTYGSLSGLCPGTYSVTCIEAGGCTVTTSFTVNDSCSNFTLTLTSTPTSGPSMCDGSITCTASGGTPTYQFSIDNGMTFTPVSTITDLCPGNYSILCEDTDGCSTIQSITINDSTTATISNLSANLTSTDDLTNNCSGSASVYPSGGIAPYTIEWSNGSTSSSVSNLCAGIYSVSIWDNGTDSTIVTFIIADSSSIYSNNPYPNGSINDTLYTDLVTNCIIDYNTIDSATLYQAVYNSSTQSLYVTWVIHSPTDTIYISDTLSLIGNTGYYNLTITVYCPNKSGNDFFKIEQVVYFDGSQVWMSTLNIAEHALDNKSIYPNPFTHSISIDNKDGVIQSVKLIDLNGRLLSEMNNLNSGVIEMNQLESLSNGTYLMILSGENSSKTYKVIK